MKELLKAEFGCLFRSKMFRILVILDVLFNIYLIYGSEEITGPVSKTPYVYIEVTQLTMLIFVEVYSFVAGAFISLFISREYSYGTMRNKIISGHSRCSIYLTELIVCSAAGMILLAGCLLVVAFTHFKYGILDEEAGYLIKMVIICCILVIVYNALIVFFSMLIDSKASSVVWSVVFIICLTVFSSMVNSKVTNDEFARECRSNGKEYVHSDIFDDTERKVYTALDSTLPMTQLMKTFTMTNFVDYGDGAGYVEEFIPPKGEETARFAAIDAGLIAAVTVLGIVFFRKKELK